MPAANRQAKHRRADPAAPRRRWWEPRRLATAVLAAATVTGVALATVTLVNGGAAFRAAGGTAAAAANGTATTGTATTGTATPAGKQATGRHGSSGAPQAARTTAIPPAPLHVVATSPTGTAVGTTPIVVRFDAPIAADSPLPQISPDTPGRWSRPSSTALRFDPDVPFVPGISVSVDVPVGMRSAAGGELAARVHAGFRVADGSVLRLQQLLAQLNYLPLTFTPSEPVPNTRAAQGALAFDPPAGTFALRFASTPDPLARLWVAGTDTAMTRGAVMAFENVHHLPIDGVAGPMVWTALLRDAAAGTLDPQPYSWAWATTTRPETLHIWQDGKFVLSAKANTGIPAAPTPTGSWPVFARYRSQTMQGTNPDGTHYRDPGVPYINYFNGGDAIHGFNRSSYGSPQSLGCIELPYDVAAQVWRLIDYGTVVTVTR